ncbi:hypothetical protein DER45DRAFT_576390, partial [Fusarium avenaceum]
AKRCMLPLLLRWQASGSTDTLVVFNADQVGEPGPTTKAENVSWISIHNRHFYAHVLVQNTPRPRSRSRSPGLPMPKKVRFLHLLLVTYQAGPAFTSSVADICIGI